MTVIRIVANVETEALRAARDFTMDLFGLRTVMDQGWIVTLAADGPTAPQTSLASHGGSGAAVPALSIEVDDIEAVLARVTSLGLPIAYGAGA